VIICSRSIRDDESGVRFVQITAEQNNGDFFFSASNWQTLVLAGDAA
jgi:hypothetical protein